MAYFNIGLLGCNAVWTCRVIPTVQRNILPQFSELMSWAIVPTYKSETSLKFNRIIPTSKTLWEPHICLKVSHVPFVNTVAHQKLLIMLNNISITILLSLHMYKSEIGVRRVTNEILWKLRMSAQRTLQTWG